MKLSCSCWKLKLHDVGFQAYWFCLIPFERLSFTWLYTLILEELRALHCCL